MRDDARPWRVAMAKAEGTSHLATNTPCQDNTAFEVLDTPNGRVLVAVVCDGAGSASHAEVGSWLSTRTMIELVEMYFEAGGSLAAIDRSLAADWIERIAMAIEADAKAQERAARDYACTLLAAIVGENGAAFLQVGDGAMVVSRGEEEDWSYVFWPQHGEFANTTNFVVSDRVDELLEFAFMPERLEEIALFSDGLENLLLHQATKSVHEPFFRRMIQPVRKLAEPGFGVALSSDLEAFLRSPRVCDRTDDDKSLILASRLGQESEPAH